jgi:hypothetical protein
LSKKPAAREWRNKTAHHPKNNNFNDLDIPGSKYLASGPRTSSLFSGVAEMTGHFMIFFASFLFHSKSVHSKKIPATDR